MMMPNIGTPLHSSRKLIARVISSNLLYTAQVSVKAMLISTNDHKLSLIYRGTTPRVGSAFRTALDDSAFVISGTLPIDIMADEMMNIYNVISVYSLSQVEKQH